MLWQDRHQPPSLNKENFYKGAQPQDTNYIFFFEILWNSSRTKVLMVNPLKIPQIKVLIKTFLGLPSSQWKEAE